MIEISTATPQKVEEGLGEAAMLWNDEIGQREYAITNQQEYYNASKLLLQTKNMIKVISDEYSPQKALADKAHKAICTSEKGFLAPLLVAEQTIKSRMAVWKDSQDAKDAHSGAVVSTVPIIKGIETREAWSCEVVSPSEVPREYLMVDEKRLKELARRTKGSVEVKGVRFHPTTTIVVRSKQ